MQKPLCLIQIFVFLLSSNPMLNEDATNFNFVHYQGSNHPTSIAEFCWAVLDENSAALGTAGDLLWKSARL